MYVNPTSVFAVMLYVFPMFLELEFRAVVEVVTDNTFVAGSIKRQLHFFTQLLNQLYVRWAVTKLDLDVLRARAVAILAAISDQMWRLLE